MKSFSQVSKRLALILILPVLLVFPGCWFFDKKGETESDKSAAETPTYKEQLSVKDSESGLYHYDPDKGDVPEPEPTESADGEIFLGAIKNQGEAWRQAQAAVDDNRELWRRDPDQVVLAEKTTYGFYPKDKYALIQQAPLENGTNALVYSIGHGQETYIAILGLAFPERGEESIWVWQEIRKHEN
jgi:hypothetical protein